MENYVDFAVQKAVELLAIDSPTGYTAEAEEFVLREFRALGCSRPTPIRSAAWSPRSRATAACAS